MYSKSNVRVLLDSWTHRRLLPGDEEDSTSGWTVYPENSTSQWFSLGECDVRMCAESIGEKWVMTQKIEKKLPASDLYSVRIYLNITYSFLDCEKCDDEGLQLKIAHYTNGTRYSYSEEGIMPDNYINYARQPPPSHTKRFFFDSEPPSDSFFLALKDGPGTFCVEVSRVLVYRYECPGRQTGLAYLPASQAPVNEPVQVTPYCAENSDFSETSNPDILSCTSEGTWDDVVLQCMCDPGYTEDESGTKCKAVSTTVVHPLVKPSSPAVLHDIPSFSGKQTLFPSPSATPPLPTEDSTEPTIVGNPATSFMRTPQSPPL
jgi:hypothetical protein